MKLIRSRRKKGSCSTRKKGERLHLQNHGSSFSYTPKIVDLPQIVELPQLDIQVRRTPTAVYDTRLIEKDINGVEYTYENKDELAFGTTYEGE